MTLKYLSWQHHLASTRGTVGSYDKWAVLVGDDSYRWQNMLPYFEKSINFSTSNLDKRAANASATYNITSYSETGGPLHLSYPSYAQPFSSCKPFFGILLIE